VGISVHEPGIVVPPSSAATVPPSATVVVPPSASGIAPPSAVVPTPAVSPPQRLSSRNAPATPSCPRSSRRVVLSPVFSMVFAAGLSPVFAVVVAACPWL